MGAVMELGTLLIVDDEKHTRDGLRLSLEDEFDVYVAADIAGAKEILKSEQIDLMVTDLRLGSENGMDLIEHAAARPQPPISIMMTAYGSVNVAVEAMKRGAYHFVTKPLNIDELEIVIKRALRGRDMERENTSLKQQVEKHFQLDNIVGRSAPMEAIFDTVRQVAPSRATVLIEGEHGTGKELIAHAIHNLSGRPKAKLTIVHCAGLSPQLLESELFGHEKGAFTNAHEKRIGRFEAADGGTLFLDEIGEIDSSTQVKLLRVLGERTIQRVGGNQDIKVDVRVVAATNKRLEEEVAKGDFREDLYYRLKTIKLTMPALKERRDDIIPLSQKFLADVAKENGKPERDLSSEALQALMAYDWPGNVRELRSAIEHGVVMCNGNKVTLRHLPMEVRMASKVESSAVGGGGQIALAPGDEFNLHTMELRLIERALEKTGNNRTEAAKLLGISRRTLQRKLKDDSAD
jgi:DNA-binding NtrC family response regulator